MEEKVLYNTLKSIGAGNGYGAAPDKEYLKALETIGLIKIGWEYKLTEVGRDILNSLRNKIEKW